MLPAPITLWSPMVTAKENDRAATDPHIVPDAVSPHVRFKPMILPVPFLPDAAFSLMI
jgi:hypothetical protein